MSDEVVGRVRYALDKQRSWRGTEWQDAPRASLPTADLRTILARLDAAEREAGAFRVQVVMALGPCAPEHEGTPVVEAIQRLREERDAANAALARYYVTPTVAGLQSDLATLRERLAGAGLTPVKYIVGPIAPEPDFNARYVEYRGKGKWAVTDMMGNVLGHDGWEWEPQPSSRDDDFLARCRYDSPQEALAALHRAVAVIRGEA